MPEQQNQQVLDDEVNLFDYGRVIWKHRILMILLFSASVVLALIHGLLSPKIYESTATILAPKEGGELGVLSAVAGIGQQALGIPSLSPNRNIFISILRSRTLAQSVADQFKLKEYYKTPDIEGAIGTLQNATKVSVSKEGVISIEVEDGDPKVAAKLANAYPIELDRLLARFGTGTAGRRRRFISEQLEKTQKELVGAEEALKLFQERNRAVSIGDQAREASAEAGRLKGEIIASEIQLKLLGGFATDSNPEVIRVKNRIGELKRQLSRAQYSTGMDLPSVSGNSGNSQKEIYLPPARAPQIGLELARLTRDVKVQETVYTFLTQQLEQARLAEAQDMPVVQLLDQAVPATHRSKPRIKRSMALAGGVSLFLGVFLVFSLEYITKQKQHSSIGRSPVSV